MQALRAAEVQEVPITWLVVPWRPTGSTSLQSASAIQIISSLQQEPRRRCKPRRATQSRPPGRSFHVHRRPPATSQEHGRQGAAGVHRCQAHRSRGSLNGRQAGSSRRLPSPRQRRAQRLGRQRYRWQPKSHGSCSLPRAARWPWPCPPHLIVGCRHRPFGLPRFPRCAAPPRSPPRRLRGTRRSHGCHSGVRRRTWSSGKAGSQREGARSWGLLAVRHRRRAARDRRLAAQGLLLRMQLPLMA